MAEQSGKSKGKIVLAGVIVMLLAVNLHVTTRTTSGQEHPQYRAVIVRGAGYLPGTEKPTEPDAITNATSEPGNTYVFSKKLAVKLSELKVDVEIIDFPRCSNLSCLEYTGADGKRHIADIVIFAGPSYGRKFPEQLETLIPKLQPFTARNPRMICSSLISANYTYRGIITMQHIDEELKKTGARTVAGVVFNSDVIENELDEDIKDFTDVILKAL